MKELLEEYGVFILIAIIGLLVIAIIQEEVNPSLAKLEPKAEIEATMAKEEVKQSITKKASIDAKHIRVEKDVTVDPLTLIISINDSQGVSFVSKDFKVDMMENGKITYRYGENVLTIGGPVRNTSLDTSKKGTFSLEYILKDSYNKIAKKTVTVLVV